MNKQPTPKSTTTHIAALWLVLAALGLPVAQLQARGRGSPPSSQNFTDTFSGICSFDVLVQVTGKQGVIFLPGGDLFITAPASFATFTNLSETTKSVTLNITGPAELGPVQNGSNNYPPIRSQCRGFFVVRTAFIDWNLDLGRRC